MCHADPTGVTILNHLVIFAMFPVFQAGVASYQWYMGLWHASPLSGPRLTYHRWEYLTPRINRQFTNIPFQINWPKINDIKAEYSMKTDPAAIIKLNVYSFKSNDSQTVPISAVLQSKYSFRACENVWPQALSSLQLGSINNIINGDKFALFVMQLGDFILITVLWS